LREQYHTALFAQVVVWALTALTLGDGSVGACPQIVLCLINIGLGWYAYILFRQAKRGGRIEAEYEADWRFVALNNDGLPDCRSTAIDRNVNVQRE
jgi:hypothetical protein